jgi:transcriptional regulator with XRE-family HTH domain
MLLHEAVTKARKDLGLTRKKLAELAGIQRKQLATLESGGNITLATLRKVLVHLPNLESFSLDAVTATVLRHVPPEEQRKVAQSAITMLADALRNMVDKMNDGHLPDDTDIQAFQQVTDTWDLALGYDEADLKRKREEEQKRLDLQLAAYKGGAAAAFASIVDVAKRKAARRRRRADRGA